MTASLVSYSFLVNRARSKRCSVAAAVEIHCEGVSQFLPRTLCLFSRAAIEALFCGHSGRSAEHANGSVPKVDE